jgi:hypothetical protein
VQPCLASTDKEQQPLNNLPEVAIMRSAHAVITTSVLALTLGSAGAALGDTDHRPHSTAYSAPREHVAQAPATPVPGPVPGPVSVARAGVAADGVTSRTANLRFLDIRGPVSTLDVGPSGGSVGDTLFFDNELWNRSGTTRLGRFISRCTTVTATKHHCQGSLLLPAGSLEVATTTDFSAPIVAAVIGGTGAYEGASGEARISPTETEGTSELKVHLVRSEER